jgi:hypothetical protein
MAIISPERMLHVVLQLPNTLPDVFHRTVLVSLLEEKLRMHGADHYLDRSDVNDVVVKVLVQARHVVEEEQLIHVDGVSCKDELSWSDAQAEQIVDDMLFCHFDRNAAVDATLVQS